MKKITGVTFIIFRPSGEILMQLRDENSKRYKNTWCFPGGTPESGEELLTTAMREAKEEYEIEVKAENCKELMIYDLSYGVSAKVFVCLVNQNQTPKLNEGLDMKWMKLEEIKSLQLGFEQEKIIPEIEKFLHGK